jgi:hypothetical protein
MLETVLFLFIAVLIVMPVVAILIMGVQRIGNFDWSPRMLAVASVTITVVLVLGYLLLT